MPQASHPGVCGDRWPRTLQSPRPRPLARAQAVPGSYEEGSWGGAGAALPGASLSGPRVPGGGRGSAPA